MIPSIISKKENIKASLAQENLIIEENNWVKNNKINFKTEKERLKYYNYLQKKSLMIIIENPLISVKHIINKTLHFAVLPHISCSPGFLPIENGFDCFADRDDWVFEKGC